MDGWQRVVTGDGSITLAHPVHGEACHPREGAWTQARERYAAGCRLGERALELRAAGATCLRLLDVGTGLGFNIAAALEALEGSGVALDVTTLEHDPAVIVAALELGPQPLVELERWHAPVRVALAQALGQGVEQGVEHAVSLEPGSLRLHLADARTVLDELDPVPCFDAVFLDPFSPRIDPPLWEQDCLSRIARRMAPGSLLSTYSAAVRVRAGLAAAGLRVGRGARVQSKAMGTLASPDRELEPFDARAPRQGGSAPPGSVPAGESRFPVRERTSPDPMI